jgi:hypothetical protein
LGGNAGIYFLIDNLMLFLSRDCHGLRPRNDLIDLNCHCDPSPKLAFGVGGKNLANKECPDATRRVLVRGKQSHDMLGHKLDVVKKSLVPEPILEFTLTPEIPSC